MAENLWAHQTVFEPGRTDLVVQIQMPDGSSMQIDDSQILQIASARKMAERVKNNAYQFTPVGAQVAEFLRYLKDAEYAARTYYEYESVLYRFALEHAHMALEEFAPPDGVRHIEEWMHEHWQGTRPGTRLKALSVLGAFFKWAYARQKVPADPMPLIRRPKQRATERQAHSRHKVMEIVKAQPLIRDQCALLLMGKLALRKNELRLLQIKHIDLEDDRLRLLQKGGDVVFHDLRFPDVKAKLAEHILLDGREPEEFLVYPRWERTLRDGTKVFQREVRDRPLSDRALHEWWVRCLERADIPHFPMHELRHTAGTEFYRAVRDMELTRQFMRHKSILTTSEVYLHLDREDMRVAYEKAALRWSEAESEERQTKAERQSAW